jgi:SAM-dependent methyltransferase
MEAYRDMAPYYDLHAPKNVPEIMAFWEFAVAHHARRAVRDVLEFACGSGRIAVPLARMGHNLTGSDASEWMLETCRGQANRAGVNVRLRHELMQDFHERDAYDAMIALFGAMGFLVDLSAIRAFFRAAHSGLRQGGFLLVDVPNALDGLVNPWAGVSAEVHHGNEMKLDRFLEQTPDTLRGTSKYRDTGVVSTPNGIRHYQEEYVLRLFSLPLLELLLDPVGFGRVTCYCNWEDRQPMQEPARRLILVLEK